ncbi:hypothetical protein NAEGRDRAFT_46491 [Naegleria gruberi]|uniref:F-box domain-containing protein n=1 Tax=Naegleria gruberi TaxID=5762 RepID=D2V3W8_NAEGR|nr:uncharacterized protein NAEGRDRAFT_46491 [Naegleria gruberi]EFC48271.1 hypothetical protein NAEGRDRAFT_46491 [Naegleria gruberi]|eukprot:XP_002681015.1 hypothetical protein NAEGRDRAFT_46491 [Naegleria gruberi strain NEG-M]
MKRTSSEDNSLDTFSSSKKQKSNQLLEMKPLNILVCRYDPFVLGHVFKFCSPMDLPSLAVVCKDWHDLYFSREKIVLILKEWVDTQWNNKICSGKLTWTWSVEYNPENEYHSLAYWLRLLNVLKEVNIMITDEQGKKDDNDEEEENEEEHDDEEEEQDVEEDEEEDDQEDEGEDEENDEHDDTEDLKKISHSVEFIEMGNTKLCKITTSSNRFLLVSNNGNIIRFKRKKKELLCSFYGGLSYPSFENCNYRSDYWVSLVPGKKGILVLQLKQMVKYLGFDDEYLVACNLIDIIGLKKAKVSNSKYTDYPWDQGEADGIIEFVPWEIVTACTTSDYDISHICECLDDRFFNSFDLFCKLIEVSTTMYTESIIKNISLKVDSEFFKNRGLLKYCRQERKLFKLLDESLRHDKEFLKEALRVNPSILKYLFKKEYTDIIEIDRELILDCLNRLSVAQQ